MIDSWLVKYGVSIGRLSVNEDNVRKNFRVVDRNVAPVGS
jgi:hypothetical protein